MLRCTLFHNLTKILKMTEEIRNSSKLLEMNVIRDKLTRSLKILRIYDWLVDSYMVDFFVENNWRKLPPSWRACLKTLEPDQLVGLISTEPNNQKLPVMWPLSILALRQLLTDLCIERKIKYKDEMTNHSLLLHKKMRHVFTKNIRPKKRHEIQHMACICMRTIEKMNINFVVDVGAGRGHLARILGYVYGVRVCCLEMQKSLNTRAKEHDEHLENMANKFLPESDREHFRRPKHFTVKIENDMQPTQFIDLLKTSLHLETDNFRFGIIGLHPCGDLNVTLIRMLLKCPQAKFLTFSSCCHMKLTTSSNSDLKTSQLGYPLSNFLCQKPNEETKLSYEAREVSCHANEQHFKGLNNWDYDDLKIHCYRAAAERIISEHFPKAKHSRINSVSYEKDMSFMGYFFKAVEGLLPHMLCERELDTAQTQKDLKQWKNVAIYYTLRLMFAPLVESIILFDRMLYMMEKGCDVITEAVFYPHISPRNHITTVIKN